MNAQSFHFRDADLTRDSRWIAALARRLARTEVEAEELEQQTYLAILAGAPPGSERWHSWVAGVMRNLARGRWRAERRRRESEARWVEAERGVGPAEAVANGETRRIVLESVMALPEPYRAAVLMRYLEGMTSAEIARRTDSPATTVRSQVSRGLELLRRDVGERLGAGWRMSCLALVPAAWRGPAAQPSAAAVAVAPAMVVRSAVAAKSVLAIAGVALLGIAVWQWGSEWQRPGSPGVAAEVAAGAEQGPRVPADSEGAVTVVDRRPLGPAPAVLPQVVAVDAVTAEAVEVMEVRPLTAGGVTEALCVYATGYLTAEVALAGHSGGSITVPMERAATITLRVLETETHAQAAGELEAIAWPSDGPWPDPQDVSRWTQVQSAFADASGRICFTQLRPGEHYEIRVAGGGLVAAEDFRGIPANGQELGLSVLRLQGVRLVPRDVTDPDADLPTALIAQAPADSWDIEDADRRIRAESILGTLVLRQLGVTSSRLDERRYVALCGRQLDKDAGVVRFGVARPGFSYLAGEAAVGDLVSELPNRVVDLVRLPTGLGSIDVALPGVRGTVRSRVSVTATGGGEGVLALTPVDEKGVANGPKFIQTLDELGAGRWSVESVPEGLYLVSVRVLDPLGEELGDALAQGTNPVRVKASQRTAVTLSSHPHGGLQLLPTAGGVPYSGMIAVVLRHERGQEAIRVIWNEAPYLLRGVTAGAFELDLMPRFRGLEADDHQPVRFHVDDGETAIVPLEIPDWTT